MFVEILQYQTAEGKRPFRDWLYSLKDVDTKFRIRARIDRLQLGNYGDCQSVGAGVFELRLHFGPGYRVYFARDGDAIVILLSGGDKSSQCKDIRRAHSFWEDYRRRK